MKRYLSLSLLVGNVLAAPMGVVNPAVTQENIHQTICVPGWTATVRPPSSYTNALKRKTIPKHTSPRLYEEDHILPLGVGGHPSDPKNLWPQPWKGKCGAKLKDVTERTMHDAVCSGTISLKDAQKQFMPWVCDSNP